MDWIDEVFEKIGIRFRNMPLRKTLWCYTAGTVLAVLLAYALTFTILNGWQEVILGQNVYKITYQMMMTQSGQMLKVEVKEVPENVNQILMVLKMFMFAAAIGYPVIAVFITSHFYYQKKLRQPLERMVEEAERIGRDDLSLPCQWETEDEMGKACEAIDKMRKRLIENKKDTWALMEEQRSLNTAFAHDIRTPLTVMQGYTELLLKFYPEGKISNEKLMETLKSLDKQVKRLKNFTETMKDIRSIEAIEVKREEKSLGELREKIEQTARGLEYLEKISIEVKNLKKGREVSFSGEESVAEKEMWKKTEIGKDDRKQEERKKDREIRGDVRGYFDEHLVLEVFENLLSNALRYAKKKIEVQMEVEKDYLFLFVRDDGRGFSQEEFYQATRPYYTDPAKKEEGTHWGLGLTICKMLCKKHGGNLTLSNSMDGGAIVCAAFFIA